MSQRAAQGWGGRGKGEGEGEEYGYETMKKDMGGTISDPEHARRFHVCCDVHV